MTALARPVGDMLFEIVFFAIGGDSELGVDSAELLIGESDGTCVCVGIANARFGGGDGVTERDSVRRV